MYFQPNGVASNNQAQLTAWTPFQLPLEKSLNAPKGILDDEQLLRRILEEVKAIKTQKAGGEEPKAEPKNAAAPKKARKKVSKAEVA